MSTMVPIALIAVLASFAGAKAQTIRALTADTLSPFSRSETDDDPGFNVELMRAVAIEAGLDLEIEWLPWKRAQARVQSEPDLLLFGVTRTAAREDVYDWATNLASIEQVFVSTGEPPTAYEDARALPHIAARSIYFTELVDAGFDNVEEGLIDANYRKLRSGRVDAVYTVGARAIFAWTRDLGFPVEELRIGPPIVEADIWLAASKGYDRDVMRRLDDALGRLRVDGTYERLHRSYFGSLPILDSTRSDQRPTADDE